VVGDGVPQQTKKKGLTTEHRRKIMEAIKKATSLGEIERLEKILSSGKIPSDFDLDPTFKDIPTENNPDKKQLEEPDTNSSKEKKNNEKLDLENDNKEKSGHVKGKEKDKYKDEDEALADQEDDEEVDATRRETADAQVDIEMTE